MNQPLFSILIANYNNGKYFSDCYKSIIAQTYEDWEVIIVDDGSTDDSVLVIKEIVGDDARFKFFENDGNHGCGHTKRRCAALATGEICAFLDPDDAITEEALQVMVAEHEKYPEASMIYSKPYFCDDALKIGNSRPAKQIQNNDPENFDLEGNMFAFLSYKNKCYQQTEGINSYLQRAVDRDLVMKLYEVAPAYFVDQPLYKYRIHNGGISNNQNEDKAYFWYWVAIIDAAKRRNVNVENLFLQKAMQTRRELALQKEIDSYNKSFIFKALRKIGLFRIFAK